MLRASNSVTLHPWQRRHEHLENEMTKSETREMKSICLYIAAGLHDVAARSLSALIRATRTKRSRAALMEQANALKLTNHPDFIV